MQPTRALGLPGAGYLTLFLNILLNGNLFLNYYTDLNYYIVGGSNWAPIAAGSERIYPRQNKKDQSLLKVPQGSGR